MECTRAHVQSNVGLVQEIEKSLDPVWYSITTYDNHPSHQKIKSCIATYFFTTYILRHSSVNNAEVEITFSYSFDSSLRSAAFIISVETETGGDTTNKQDGANWSPPLGFTCHCGNSFIIGFYRKRQWIIISAQFKCIINNDNNNIDSSRLINYPQQTAIVAAHDDATRHRGCRIYQCSNFLPTITWQQRIYGECCSSI